MRLIDKPTCPPYHCAVAPHIHEHPKGFVDTGTELLGWDPHIVVAVECVEQMGQLIGLPTQDEWDQACDSIGELHTRVLELEEDLEEATRVIQSIDNIESAGFRARKRKGPKPKEKVHA